MDITYMIESTSTIIYVLLQQNGFDYYQSQSYHNRYYHTVVNCLIQQRNLFKLFKLFRVSTNTFLRFWPFQYYFPIDFLFIKRKACIVSQGGIYKGSPTTVAILRSPTLSVRICPNTQYPLSLLDVLFFQEIIYVYF